MLKEQLRLDYSERRSNISFESLSNLSLSIANQILKLPIWSFNYYHIFLPISEKKEIDTSFILSILQGKDKNIVLPKMSKDNSLMHYLLTDNTTIKKNKLNIPEPIDGLEVSPSTLEVIFMPLLAFDLVGHRVGYGKGMYDSFLKECNPDVIKIGLSLFEAENKIIDVREGDIAMDYCVTPSRVYKF